MCINLLHHLSRCSVAIGLQCSHRDVNCCALLPCMIRCAILSLSRCSFSANSRTPLLLQKSCSNVEQIPDICSYCCSVCPAMANCKVPSKITAGFSKTDSMHMAACFGQFGMLIDLVRAHTRCITCWLWGTQEKVTHNTCNCFCIISC